MSPRILQRLACLIALPALAVAVRADDLQVKKNISVNGTIISSTETAVKGSRERTVNAGNVTVRQCDLKRTVSLNDQAQTYFVAEDPVDENVARAAALAAGVPAPAESGGKIVVTTNTTDTGERKQMFGYTARHLKTTLSTEPSANACSKVSQKFEIDGWYADLPKGQAVCSAFNPPVQMTEGCQDKVVQRHTGNGKTGYPLVEDIAMHNADGSIMQLKIETAELSKQTLDSALFEVPANYRQVNTMAELRAAAPAAQQVVGAPMQPTPGNANTQALMQQGVANMSKGNTMSSMGMSPMSMNPMAMMQQMMGGGAQQQVASAPVAAPKVLGPKAPGKIRIGIASPDAQVGQGTNSGGDYSTPIRNSIVALMDGPAVEIAALDARIPIQLQAEAQQKQCDYVLYSAVTVKHGSGGSGFGKLMKMAAPISNVVPMVGMTKGIGSVVAAQAAGAAASAAAMSAQQQAVNQLAGFNSQIKQKDDVTVQYQLVPTGQTAPRLQNSLQGKAKSDGEDVLTPLLQQTANSVLTEVTKK
jgi:hypothetical protein